LLLAVSAQTDSITLVQEKIEKLMKQLLLQKNDEIKKYEWCGLELAKSSTSMEDAIDVKHGFVTNLADLGKTMQAVDGDLDGSTQAILEVQARLAKLAKTREAERVANKQTIEDQRLSQNILAEAIAKLKQVYTVTLVSSGFQSRHKHRGLRLLQGKQPKFTKYQKSAAGSEVINLLVNIKKDSEVLEEKTLLAEKEAQTDYKVFVANSKATMDAYQSSVVSLSQESEELKLKHADTAEGLQRVERKITDLSDATRGLHKICDFILENFKTRQNARNDEIAALREAQQALTPS